MKFFPAFILSLPLFQASAQTKPDSLALKTMDEVVVTATRTPRTLGNVAIPVQLIPFKTIMQSGSLRLNDIMAEQTGMAIMEGFGKGIQVQGLSPEYTMILIDGEPLIGRTGGVLDISRITVRNIRKIEVVKGPSSSLYGSEALGGVINIITDQSGKNNINAGLRYGSFKTLDATAGFSRKLKKTDFSFNTNYNRSNGFSLKPNAVEQAVEPFWRASNQLKVSRPVGKHLKAGAGLRSNITHIDNTIRVQNVGAVILSKGFERNEEYNATPFLEFTPNNRNKTALRGYVTGFRAVQKLTANSGKDGYDDQFRQRFMRLEAQHDLQVGKSTTITGGAGAINENVSSNRYDSLSTLRSNRIYYLFAQQESKPVNGLTIITGLRYDANQSYASVWSPKVALHYAASPVFKLNASFGRGFKAPDFRQLYLNFTNLAAGAYSVFGTEVAKSELKRLGAAGLLEQTTAMAERLNVLKPEVSNGFNAGFSYQLHQKVLVSGNFFRNDLKNMIVTDVIAFKKSGGQIYSYFNLKNALTQGFDVNVDGSVGKHFSIKSGYQFLMSADKEVLQMIRDGMAFQRDKATGQVSRMSLSDYGGLPNRSKHMANLKFTYEKPSNHFATLRLIYRSRWGTTDADGNGLINREDEFAKGYLQINCSAGLEWKQQWKLIAGIDNVLNYKDIANLPGTPGRNLYIDLHYTFK